MSNDYISQLPMWKWFLDRYAAKGNSALPGGGKIDYVAVFNATHAYLNENVHPTVQQRAPLQDAGVYLTDHGPRHIEVVMRRASQLIRTKKSAQSEREADHFYLPCLRDYEIFLLVLAIHFHDIGNMYGRAGHEKRVMAVMESIGSLKALSWTQRTLIARIAASHGGTVEGDKDTIRYLVTEESDGDVLYRPQLVAAVLRLADELADESSRADSYGLMAPDTLPETCLLYHKYAQNLRVSLGGPEGGIGLSFALHADDLRQPLKRVAPGGSHVSVYLLDEIYERTLKTYNEARYCSYFMKPLEISYVEVSVKIEVFESPHTTVPFQLIAYQIGGSAYPGSKASDLKSLSAEFVKAPSGEQFAAALQEKAKTHVG